MKSIYITLTTLFVAALISMTSNTATAQSTVIQYEEHHAHFEKNNDFYAKVRTKGQAEVNEQEVRANNGVEVFPNPAPTQQITVRFTSIAERVIQVIEPTGERVYEEIVQGDTHQLDLSGLPKGVYTMMITNTETNIRTIERITIGR